MATDGSEIPNWKKRESFGSALVQILLVGAVLGGTVFFVYSRGNNKKVIAELTKEARSQALKGNAADVKKAIATAEEALAKDTASGDTNALLASLHADLWLIHRDAASEAKAKDYLEKARKAESQSEERYGTEALVLLASGDAKKAEDFVEELRKKGGSGARLFYAQAMAQRNQGNLKLAAIGFKGAMDKQWKDLNYADAWGEELLAEGTPGALDTFTKASGQNPDHIRTRLGLALARVQKKDRLGDAENLLKEVMQREAELTDPQKARATALGALLLGIQEQYDQAIAIAEKAIALNPEDPWALHAKALALGGKKDPAAAAAFDAVVAKAPYSPVFYFEGAQALQKAGQLDAGLALLAKYEAFFKNVKNATADGKEEIYLDRDDRYWLARGDLLKNAGKIDDAMASYDKAIAAKSLHLSRAYYAKATAHMEKKEFDKASELLTDITPQDGTGTLPDAYMAMGDIFFQKKEFGPGCQNYAFALAKMKITQAPREKLNEIITDVEKRLKAANQKDVAKAWVEEAKPLIQ